MGISIKATNFCAITRSTINTVQYNSATQPAISRCIIQESRDQQTTSQVQTQVCQTPAFSRKQSHSRAHSSAATQPIALSSLHAISLLPYLEGQKCVPYLGTTTSHTHTHTARSSGKIFVAAPPLVVDRVFRALPRDSNPYIVSFLRCRSGTKNQSRTVRCPFLIAKTTCRSRPMGSVLQSSDATTGESLYI
jgi:hypothetical protein